MKSTDHPLSGVYAAAVTPMGSAGIPLISDIPILLDFLSDHGCHGALLTGTTGEGPSFSPEERRGIWTAAAKWRENKKPSFRLLAGTGTPSLTETIELTKVAFDLGFEAVCVLPPFFFRNASEDGLFNWFEQVIKLAVPDSGFLLGYHIPSVSGVALPLSLLQRLNVEFPERFAGLKDSSGSLDSARQYASRLPGKAVLVGNDKLLEPGLEVGAAGCITAGANLWSDNLREIYDAHIANKNTQDLQAEVNSYRAIMDATPPAPAFAKALLHARYNLPLWKVRPPLRDLSDDQIQTALNQFPIKHEIM